MIVLPSSIAISDNEQGLPFNGLLLISASTLFSCMVLAAGWRQWPRASLVLMTILGLFALPEGWFLLNYGSAIDANALSLLAETNPAEANDYFESFRYWHFAAACLPLAFARLAWPARSGDRTRNDARTTWKLGLAGAAGLGTIFAIACWVPDVGQSPVVDATFPMAPIDQAVALRVAYPAGLPLLVIDYSRDRAALTMAVARTRVFRFGAAKLPPGKHRRVYVLVIGETSRADHLSINGYPRDTTPALAKRRDLVSFKRMYTVSTFTRLSVPVIVSRKPPNDQKATFAEASIVSAFKEAGFRTLWISLQAPVGFHESPVSVHAYEADRTVFLNPVDYRSHGKHDGDAIALLRRALDDPLGPDTFIVIHTLGSHFRYTDRYPAGFRRFLPDRRPDRPLRLLDRQDKRFLINGYDNTIAYLDHVLDGLIETLDQHDAVDSWLLYSSDHGEALFDDCRMYSGHGQSSLATHSVASVFWASHRYRNANAAKVAAIAAHQDTLASTAMLFETAADLGGLGIPGTRPGNSLAATPLRVPSEVASVEADDARACSAGTAP